MDTKVTGALIRSTARELLRMTVDEVRAEELARDVERLNGAAMAAAEDGDFNDEPARFTSMLLKLKARDARR